VGRLLEPAELHLFNHRNLDAHFDCLARDLRPLIQPGTGKIVLDYGCGEALAAERLAEALVHKIEVRLDCAPCAGSQATFRETGMPRLVMRLMGASSDWGAGCHSQSVTGVCFGLKQLSEAGTKFPFDLVMAT
jgi:hypothetical protein